MLLMWGVRRVRAFDGVRLPTASCLSENRSLDSTMLIKCRTYLCLAGSRTADEPTRAKARAG